MKIAIIHDDLMRKGGAEQVALSMLKAFPLADFYTLCYNKKLTYKEFENYKIRTSLFQVIAKSEKIMKWLFFPLGLWAMKLMYLKNYDIVLVSTTFCGKYVRISPKTRVYFYIHVPFRLIWEPTSYAQYVYSKGIKKMLFDAAIHILRKIDLNSIIKANVIIANTKETEKKIQMVYGIKNVLIINPPVKVENFYIDNHSPKVYYLLVSRLEYYKKVDLAIEAFNDLGLKLIIVGNGSKKSELLKMAKKNIEFRHNIDSEELSRLYSNCKALIFPQHEDYGITPLESNASGRPVIAYGKGGINETMIPYMDENKFTSIFFYNQTKQSLIEAIKKLEMLNIDSNFIRSNALQFSEESFVNQLRQKVN